MNNKWLKWASELQSIAQAGLTFGADKYDLDRYEQIRSIAVDILHEYTDIDHSKIRELFASETGYQTPKVDIRASVFKDARILMVREKIDGAWSLPGGWADVNTSLNANLLKTALRRILKPLMQDSLSWINYPSFLLRGILLTRSECVSRQKNVKYSRLSLINKSQFLIKQIDKFLFLITNISNYAGIQQTGIM
jgi:hypothetical protein